MFFQRLLFGHYLDKDETLFYAIHRHWITIKDQMLKIAFFGYTIPLFLLLFLVGLDSPLSYFLYLWLGISLLYSLYGFLDWYLDAWLVTDISIIETSWDGFFKQRSSRIEYAAIESIDVDVKGIKQKILNYGNIVLIKSSGVNIRMESISKPHSASSWMSKIRTEILASQNTQNSESIKSLLADIIHERIKINS